MPPRWPIKQSRTYVHMHRSLKRPKNPPPDSAILNNELPKPFMRHAQHTLQHILVLVPRTGFLVWNDISCSSNKMISEAFDVPSYYMRPCYLQRWRKARENAICCPRCLKMSGGQFLLRWESHIVGVIDQPMQGTLYTSPLFSGSTLVSFNMFQFVVHLVV